MVNFGHVNFLSTGSMFADIDFCDLKTNIPISLVNINEFTVGTKSDRKFVN